MNTPNEKKKYSIDILLEELRAESGPPQITKEEYEKAARRINASMEEFNIEWRAYMAQSIESAKHAYITF